MNNVNLMIFIITVGALLASCSSNVSQTVHYTNPIYYDETAPFRDTSGIKKAILDECKIEENMVSAILQQSKKNGLPLSNMKQDRTLKVTISQAYIDERGLNNLYLPTSYLSVELDVLEGDKSIFHESRRCRTNKSGVLGLKPTNCGNLERCARNSGVWLAERTFRGLSLN